MTAESQKRDKCVGTVCRGFYPDGEKKYICISEEGVLILSRVSKYVFVFDILKKGITPNMVTETDFFTIFDGEESVTLEPLQAGETTILEQEFDVADKYFTE